MIVHFTEGYLAGQTREIDDDKFGFIRDDGDFRWHYVLRDGGHMKLFWTGTVDQWKEQDVFYKFMEDRGLAQTMYVNFYGEPV